MIFGPRVRWGSIDACALAMAPGSWNSVKSTAPLMRSSSSQVGLVSRGTSAGGIAAPSPVGGSPGAGSAGGGEGTCVCGAAGAGLENIVGRGW